MECYYLAVFVLSICCVFSRTVPMRGLCVGSDLTSSLSDSSSPLLPDRYSPRCPEDLQFRLVVSYCCD